LISCFLSSEAAAGAKKWGRCDGAAGQTSYRRVCAPFYEGKLLSLDTISGEAAIWVKSYQSAAGIEAFADGDESIGNLIAEIKGQAGTFHTADGTKFVRWMIKPRFQVEQVGRCWAVSGFG